MNCGSKRDLFPSLYTGYRLGVIFILYSIVLHPSQGQSVGFNNSTPDASSIIDAAATDRGVLIPRMTSTQRNAISSPANGLLVYDTDFDLFFFNSGTTGSPIWVPINSGYHANKTRIKILPNDFIATSKDNEDVKGWGFNNVTDGNSSTGTVMGDANTDLVTFINIPTGFQATHVTIYGSDTDVTFEVYESNINDGNMGTSIGSANVGSEADITDTQSTATNFLVIIVNFNTKETDRAYGGYVTIAPY